MYIWLGIWFGMYGLRCMVRDVCMVMYMVRETIYYHISGSYDVLFYDGFKKTVQPINVKTMPLAVQKEVRLVIHNYLNIDLYNMCSIWHPSKYSEMHNYIMI